MRLLWPPIGTIPVQLSKKKNFILVKVSYPILFCDIILKLWVVSRKPFKRQYRNLYIETIRDQYLKFDLNIPFVSSSPTNGVESEKEDWIAKNPYDSNYGDLHHYDYKSDCRDWSNFPKTKFASEFGYQAWSTLASIYDATHNQTDLRINSTWLEHRNHHGDGNIQIQNFIKMLVGNQKTGSSKKDAESDFQKYIYLSQLSQSICTGNEAKFYRSMAGINGTMGSLYWQLNDVWSGATWSSLDNTMKAKPLHFTIAKIYNDPISLITYQNTEDIFTYENISVYLVSSLSTTVSVNIT